jgi:hypothetical protein
MKVVSTYRTDMETIPLTSENHVSQQRLKSFTVDHMTFGNYVNPSLQTRDWFFIGLQKVQSDLTTRINNPQIVW